MSPIESNKLPSEIRSILARLQSRIRRYVIFEGLAIAVIWLGLTFWLGLALDYLPVLLGASEMPRGVRVFLLLVIAGVLAYILNRWVLRRLFVRLRETSMAILLERRFPSLRDSLVTAVELNDQDLSKENHEDAELHREMLSKARSEAVDRVRNIELDDVFNRRPLWSAMSVAILLVLSILVFGVMSRDVFATWTSRMYGLSDVPWPRRAQIEVLGLTNNQVKIARGSDFIVRVRADASRDTPPPDVCTIHYRSTDGERGRINMNKQGRPRDRYQFYTYEGRPFQGILSDLAFDVVGFDHRVSDCQIFVVESPKVVGVELATQFPAYTELLPSSQPYRPGIQLPRGSAVTLQVATNKPLLSATIQPTGGESLSVNIDQSQDGKSFEFRVANLDEDLQIEIDLLDRDEVTSQQPYRLFVTATEDRAPTIQARLRGIGTSVTQNARIPAEGEITDDFGVARTWFELENGAQTFETPIRLTDGLALNSALDLQSLAETEDGPKFEESQRIVLTVRAMDKYDLGAAPNIGDGDRYGFDVVSPEKLMALLEARELDLRRRFEQMIVEMTDMRDSLIRVQTPPKGNEPSDVREPRDDEGSVDWSRLVMLLIQRANQHADRAAEEVRGVALSFDDISEELTNNRIDSQERKARLEGDISTPLKHVANTMLPELNTKLGQLESALATDDYSGEAESATLQADNVVQELEKVLEKMLDLESYNELLEIVRSLIDEQDAVSERTRKLQKQQALELVK